MKRRSVVRAYEPVHPDAAAKERMLRNILHSSEISPAGKEKNVKTRRLGRFVLVAVVLLMLVGTTVFASDYLKIRILRLDSFVNDNAQNQNVILHDSDHDTGSIPYENGTIEFQFKIDAQIVDNPMPVIEVVPDYLTEDDVQRIANVLFPGATFYEAEPIFARKYSKSEIQERIERWSRYNTPEALLELFKVDSSGMEYHQEAARVVNCFIEDYKQMLQTASDENIHELCRWKFRKNSYYVVDESEIRTRNLNEDDDSLQLSVTYNNIPYTVSASKREKNDYVVNDVAVYFDSGINPYDIDREIFKMQLCRTDEPTQEQLDSVKRKAQMMLDKMEVGVWEIDNVYVQTQEINEYRNYVIRVTAVPVLNGATSLRRAQLQRVNSPEPGAPRMCYTDVEFKFSANGDLIEFHLWSPINVVNTLESVMVAQDIEEQLEIAKQYLSTKNFSAYGLGMTVGDYGESLGCIVEVNDLKYNLTRINGEDPLTCYYYVPGIQLSGSVRYYGIETGKTYIYRENVTFVVMDGVTGEILMKSYN